MSAAAETGRRVVIFTDDPGWHGKVLVRAFAVHGLEAHYASLVDCRLDLSGPRPRVHIPCFEDAPPVGAFVRGVPGGTLEEVILRLDVLHALDLMGVPVYNTGRAIERSVDKALTSFLLLNAQVATPPTWVLSDREAARGVLAEMLDAGGTLVMKPLFGSQGEGLQRLQSMADLEAAQPVNGVFYLQRFVERATAPYVDYRVLVVQGEARYAMSRTSEHWITNRAQGARCEGVTLLPEMKALAEAASAALAMDYAGVDLLCDADGRWWVGEVNGVPAWWGLQQACGPEVTTTIVKGFLGKLRL